MVKPFWKAVPARLEARIWATRSKNTEEFEGFLKLGPHKKDCSVLGYILGYPN